MSNRKCPCGADALMSACYVDGTITARCNNGHLFTCQRPTLQLVEVSPPIDDREVILKKALWGIPIYG